MADMVRLLALAPELKYEVKVNVTKMEPPKKPGAMWESWECRRVLR